MQVRFLLVAQIIFFCYNFLMNEEERALLNRVAKTVEENNEILHRLQRSMRWGTVLRWVYWILIIGTAFGSFYLLQPYLNSLANTYGGAKSDVANFQSFMNSLKAKAQ